MPTSSPTCFHPPLWRENPSIRSGRLVVSRGIAGDVQRSWSGHPAPSVDSCAGVPCPHRNGTVPLLADAFAQSASLLLRWMTIIGRLIALDVRPRHKGERSGARGSLAVAHGTLSYDRGFLGLFFRTGLSSCAGSPQFRAVALVLVGGQTCLLFSKKRSLISCA
jgi:hypothetical protein